MIDFAANVLGRPLDPWQQWLLIHLGEMLPDGRPRFRKVLVIVARQNGKTWLCTVLALFWLYVQRWPLVFGTSNKLEYAADAWHAAKDIALSTPALAGRTRRPRLTNGQNDLPTTDRCHYKIGAANDDGGRSKSVDRAIGDELRQQKDWTAYAALVPAMIARPHAQIVWITNMGDATAVVLNEQRREAEEAIEALTEHVGAELPLHLLRPTGLYEWSAAAGSHPADPAALAQANPQAGRRIHWDDLLAEAHSVARPGADPVKLAKFMTENLCIPVDQMDPAVDPAAWAAADKPAEIPADVPVAACVDVSRDHQHATLAVAAVVDGIIRVEVVASWSGPAALAELRRDLRARVLQIRPTVFGWLPGGPGAALDAELRDRRKTGRYMWPPRGTRVAEIRGETSAVCMGFADVLAGGELHHSGQELLDQHAGQAEKLWGVGNRWVFTPSGSVHIDALYAAAGAVHLARVTPAPRRASGQVHGVVV